MAGVVKACEELNVQFFFLLSKNARIPFVPLVEPPPPPGPLYEPRHDPTVGSYGVAVSYKRGTPVNLQPAPGGGGAAPGVVRTRHPLHLHARGHASILNPKSYTLDLTP